MANTVATQTLHDGPRNAVVKVYIASDGASGELTDQVVVDASALAGAPSTLKLLKLVASTTGCSLVLEWDATTDVGLVSIPSDVTDTFDFCAFGGIPNDAGAGKTGDVVLSTTGFTAAGDSATLILHLAKAD